MPRSSDSLPDEPLPFGTDNHIHQNYRRSSSVGRPAREQDGNDNDDYAAFVADTQASYTAPTGGRASIAPSNIQNVPNKLKRLLRKYPILRWVLIGVFQLGVILLTAGVVLAATTAHAKGPGGAKVAVIILVIWGIAFMASSAAGSWTVWKGRKERARLERQWAVEEEIKERGRVREKAKEDFKRQEIKERERSLSRSRGRRSKSRGRSITGVQRHRYPAMESRPSFQERRRSESRGEGLTGFQRQRYPAMESRPSFQEMTPAPSQYPHDDESKPLPLVPTSPIPADALGILGTGDLSPQRMQPHHSERDQADRDSTWTHHLDVSDSDSSQERARVLTNVLRQNDGLMRDIVRTVSRTGTPQAQVFTLSPTTMQAASAILDSNSTAPDSGSQDYSATLINSSPEHEPLVHSHSFPTYPGNRFYTAPISYRGSTPLLHSSGDPTSSPSERVMDIIRSYTGGQGSEQSDENFMAGVDNPSDADSLDDNARQFKKAKSVDIIRNWDPELDPAIDDVLGNYSDQEARDEAGSEGGDVVNVDDRRSLGGRVRRLTGLMGFVDRRRSRSVGGWSEGAAETEGRESRLERFRGRLRRTRRESAEQQGEQGRGVDWQSWN